MSRVTVSVHGLVQGVFFRASTVTRAKEHGLVGWVKNSMDPQIEEAVAEGPHEQGQEFVT